MECVITTDSILAKQKQKYENNKFNNLNSGFFTLYESNIVMLFKLNINSFCW